MTATSGCRTATTAETIYLDNCGYNLYAYTSGVTVMSLQALGSYDQDLSGDYTLMEVAVYDGSGNDQFREQYSSGQEITGIMDASSLVGGWKCMGENGLLYSIDNYEDGTGRYKCR